MIKVNFLKKENGEILGFSVIGHAGYAENGKDIVCSAVSALVINTINSIDQLTGDEIKVNSDEYEGLIELEILSPISNETKLLIESLILGINSIKESNNEKYISVFFKEV